ncbi:MAG: 1-aminocyclopropane-1-carboxylate deaminase/D-cysteine desulfhydrase [Bacteroidota bacterium]|jgi:1-aminocyclopropane-1-carboxylate deaminase
MLTGQEMNPPDLVQVRWRGMFFKMLLLDAVHPGLGGNKWFKLKYNLEAFSAGNFAGMVSMAGAYSNHLYALAWMRKISGIQISCFIRGMDAPEPSATLLFAKEQGVHLIPLKRSEYMQLRNSPNGFLESYGLLNHYWIPEGAANEEGMKGCSEIVDFIPPDCSDVILPFATGASCRGMLLHPRNNLCIHAMAVLKGYHEKDGKMQEAISANRFKLYAEAHDGGYAKSSAGLRSFVKEFWEETGILTDLVYNGKALYAATQTLIPQLMKTPGSVLYVHTGGLQNGLNHPF